MAGYIEWEKGLADKPEVFRMACLLKKHPDEIAGKVMRFWEWTDDNVPEESIDPETGHAEVSLSPNRGDNETYVDSIVRLPGFCAAMSEVGWIVHRSSSLLLPNFGRHNGLTAKTRARNTKNQANRRAKLADEMSPNAGDKKVTTQPYPTQPNNWGGILRNVAVEELRTPSKLLVRYQRAVAAGAIPDSESNRLIFFGFAARALAKADSGKEGGFFRTLVLEWKPDKVTDGFEDKANQMLKEALYGK